VCCVGLALNDVDRSRSALDLVENPLVEGARSGKRGQCVAELAEGFGANTLAGRHVNYTKAVLPECFLHSHHEKGRVGGEDELHPREKFH
jgi:hypothetical protein